MLTLNFSIDKGASFMDLLLKIVYNQNRYFGLSPIQKPKSKRADTFAKITN